MNWDGVEKNVRPDGLLSKIFGILKPSKPQSMEIGEKSEFVGSACNHTQTDETLREVEYARACALETVRWLTC